LSPELSPFWALSPPLSLPLPLLAPSLPLLLLSFLGLPEQSRWSAFCGLPSDLQDDDDPFFGGSLWFGSLALSAPRSALSSPLSEPSEYPEPLSGPESPLELPAEPPFGSPPESLTEPFWVVWPFFLEAFGGFLPPPFPPFLPFLPEPEPEPLLLPEPLPLPELPLPVPLPVPAELPEPLPLLLLLQGWLEEPLADEEELLPEDDPEPVLPEDGDAPLLDEEPELPG
jgi:hypothetical protein